MPQIPPAPTTAGLSEECASRADQGESVGLDAKRLQLRTKGGIGRMFLLLDDVRTSVELCQFTRPALCFAYLVSMYPYTVRIRYLIMWRRELPSERTYLSVDIKSVRLHTSFLCSCA